MHIKSIFLCMLLPLSTWAFQLPKDLSQNDRKQVLNLLSTPSSTKILASPVPLGGYSGVEISASVETIDTASIATLGGTTTDPGSISVSKLTLGKGLYNNVDIFMNFTPRSTQDVFTGYGMLIKWAFYEAEFFPINVSALAHLTNLSFNDQMTSEVVGGDIMAGVSLDNFSLYFGFGSSQAKGTFMGGAGSQAVVGAADPNLQATNTTSETTEATHNFAGVSYSLGRLFVAAQLDRYEVTVYSGKLGFRL